MSNQTIDIPIRKAFNSISLAFSCLLLLTLLTLAFIDLKHVNRVTIRLIVGIVIADFITHIGSLLAIGTQDIVGSPYCEGLTAFHMFGRLFYSFTNLAISFHLHRSIVKLKKASFKYELYVWIAMMITIGLIMIAYHFLGFFSGSNGKHSCTAGSDNRLFNTISVAIIGLVNLATLSSCVYVNIVGRRNLTKYINAYTNLESNPNLDQSNLKTNIRKIAERSFLYPLSTLITITPEVILIIWMMISKVQYFMFVIVSFAAAMAGMLTSIAFVLDPSVWNSIKIAKKQIFNSKGNQLNNDENEMDSNFQSGFELQERFNL